MHSSVPRKPLCRFPVNLVMTTVLATSLLITGCGIDAAVFGHFTATDQREVPGAGANYLSGQCSALGAGATVRFFTPSGVELNDLQTATGPDGTFQIMLPASTSFNNLIVEVSLDNIAYWGIVSEVRAKSSVFIPDQYIDMADLDPEMADIGLDSTLTSLVLLGKATYGLPPIQLASISPDTIVESAAVVNGLIASGDERIIPLREYLERLYTNGTTTAPALVAFPNDGNSYLDIDQLAQGADLDNDGVADANTDAFDSALRAAVEAVEVNVCFAADRITVVFMVDFSDGNQDRNCAEIDRWKWTKDEEGKQMYIVGSLHEETPLCDGNGDTTSKCLDEATFDAASQLLGNWQPNLIAMYDDGSNGDAVAGDNVWTLALELPWFDAGAETASWVRVSYKYTWGQGGALWTGSEEWPGNRRILELQDIDGDRIITRYDRYADETTNKDVQNLLSPVNGGCGSILWNSEEPLKDTCVYDTLENYIDTDGDCELDSKPTPGTASPITVPCSE
ncbi:MAG: choice-of-anchor X domain-containing protein [Myxococcota bacterium]|nr:choice-of-anchor X domain-containing protein [Myxococcota bacterium]